MVRQSEREEVYRDALARLTAQHLVYGCSCSRTHVEGGAFRPRLPRARLKPRPSMQSFPIPARAGIVALR